MPDDSHLEITDSVRIPRAEIDYRATRSGGPGGQHVNTSATRVELAWDVAGSPALAEEQRARIRKRLSNRITGEGVLQLSEGGSRSQHRNKEAVTERLVELLQAALRPRKKRKKTRPPRAAKERRLRQKKRKGELKRLRGRVRREE